MHSHEFDQSSVSSARLADAACDESGRWRINRHPSPHQVPVPLLDVSGVAYQASKHGLTGLAHGTRVEEKANGIRTTIIFPGLCKTEILDKRPVPTPQEVLDQALEPQDVADAVLFVAGLPSRAVVPELQLFPSRL